MRFPLTPNVSDIARAAVYHSKLLGAPVKMFRDLTQRVGLEIQ